jgi:general secretion pathway protein D
LSAKRTHTVLLVALSQFAVVGAAQALRAATPPGSSGQSPSAQAAPQKPLTREEADQLLHQAHSAIEQGRLEEAEKLLSRVESAHVNFSVFHVGPTTESIRRELSRAQHAAHANSKSSAQAGNNGQSHVPFARPNSSTKGPEDPFATRNLSAEAKTNTPPATSGALTPPKHSLAGISAPDGAAPSTTSNPYTHLDTGAKLASNESPAAGSPSSNGVKYPVTTAAATDNPFHPALAGASALDSSSRSEDPYAHHSSSDESPAHNSTNGSPKQQAKAKLIDARKALEAGDLQQAERLTKAANALGVPESEYLPNEDRPSLVAWDIARAKQKAPAAHATSPTIERLPATTDSRYESPSRAQADLAIPPGAITGGATPADYRTNEDNDKRLPNFEGISAESTRVTSLPSADVAPRSRHVVPSEPPMLQAAADGPRITGAAPIGGPDSYRIAAAESPRSEDLPLPDAGAPPTDQAAPPTADATPAPKGGASLIDSATANQRALAQQLNSEVGKRQTEAQRLQEKDPERAIATLHEAQKLVNDSKLSDLDKKALLTRIEITLNKAESYSKEHKSEIDLNKQNQAVLNERDRDHEMKLKLQQKIAEMVDEFNRLRDEQRFEEMELVARRLNELAPNDAVAQQVWLNAKFIRREMMNRQLADDKEGSIWKQLNAVETSAINPVAEDGHEMVRDQKYWHDFVQNRKGSAERIQHLNERELDIERKLRTPVLLKYQDTPLSEVMSGLSELTGVNIHLDPRGLTQEGVNSDTPVTINLTKEISLKSALNLILEPLHLGYVVNDEVLKVTSEQLRDGKIYEKVYNVADLVTPIPNFVPSNNIGLQGLINESMAASNRGKPGFASTSPTVLVNDRNQKAAGPNGDVLAQQFNAAPTNGMSPSTVPIGSGPGGMGAGANADFDSLIDLITSTVSTDTWAENGGGQAEIRPFPTNLSLVISQTQAVHEEIADLLQQLRRLQDLQVTIEVRFIRLNDSFFERIGVDFQMNIKDNGVTPANQGQFQPANPQGRSNTVGLLPPAGTNSFPNFTADLDIPFRQGSFNLATPQFGGFDPNGAANFGFAILSDLQAYFLIQAAQGDRRTNVLNAPKVTLFNGQQAFVADATQRPFVVGVIPVVGEFASASQPVIVVLNEGTMMTIQAVVSEDRRYVRMTIVPFFTQIGNVDTFTFEGSASSTTSSSTSDANNDGKNEKNDNSASNNNTGVTVQLPSFSFVSVVTTVSVPDGGTVLLGGIKRLSEGRSEFGVPLLSKIPYINRLFRNVGIGRETDSLMMMVTPRIIIQEEEEERLGVSTTPTP